jgi:hypothetical protein
MGSSLFRRGFILALRAGGSKRIRIMARGRLQRVTIARMNEGVAAP